MQELMMTPSTLILLSLVVVCAVLAIKRLRSRGMCDRNDHCGGCCNKDRRECCSCKAAENMVANMQQSK